MLILKFAGYFQCRLSTDTDPPDETRGVSGYAHALPGEPDLDRILRFQTPGNVRSHCSPVGVKVSAVVVDGRPIDSHPLVGANVDLLDEPKFEGRNGIAADDGYEPIVPFHLQVKKNDFLLQRSFAEKYEFWPSQQKNPFEPLRASGVHLSPGEVADETRVWNLAAVWGERADRLRDDLASEKDPDARFVLQERIKRLDQPGLLRFYGARMLYFVALEGPSVYRDAAGTVPRKPNLKVPWLAELWLGGWDADAFMGFAKGYFHIPLEGRSSDAREMPGRMISSARVRPELRPGLGPVGFGTEQDT